MAAKRRKVGNMLALAVLAVVVERPMHPYEMASVIKARGKEQDMTIKWGSFYTVVGNLAKHRLIEPVESNRQGGRPERTVYRITDAGREELADWARELITELDREPPKFEAGLSVMPILGPDEATALLTQRLERLDEQIERQRDSLTRDGTELPRLFLVEVEYDLALREAEATWLRALVGELSDGSFPGLEQWRRFHTTGVLPPELAELAAKGSDPDEP
ncbi:MAG: PadR family transcriptional regulator [Micromonosporaceae bacterium]